MCVEIEERKNSCELKSAVWLPRGIVDVFTFFSDARNLNLITPAWIRFRIQTPMPVGMVDKRGRALDNALRLTRGEFD